MLPPYGDNPVDSVARTNFRITMRDGVIIDCLKWVPLNSAPSGGWPTVIMVHGYGDNKETLSEFCRLQAQYGYYTMTFSVRGQGLSGGLSNLISTIEADDLIEIVSWIKSDSSSGSNPSKILIMGGSQGGALPMIAATRGMQVAAIINSVAPPDFASSWIENGSIKMTLLWTIEYTSDTARYNSTVSRMSDWIYADNKQYWDSLAHYLPISRDYYTSLNSIQVPVLIEVSWQDKFFNANGWLQYIDKVTSPMSSYMGAVQGHGGDHSPTEDIWHMEWFNNWFFEWLWGIHTPVLDQAKYQYASTMFPVVNNKWFSFAHDSSTVLLRNISTGLKLYLGKNEKLRTSPQGGGSKQTLKNTVNDNYTLQDAVYDEFKGADFINKFKVDTLKFVSNPLTTDLEWTGTPAVKVDYKSSARDFVQLNFQVYEVLQNGTVRFINRANFTDRNYTRNSRRTAAFKGQAHSHRFKAGSKIMLLITNLDRAHTDYTFFETNPFVLPVMKKGNHEVFLNANSYIELPIVNPGAGALELAFEEDASGTEINTPNKFSLQQNYPNPFNPSTVIEYSIANSSHVELKVYDLLGKEVQTLVSGFQNPGSHSVTFNAINLSSGVYFYRLNAGSFNNIKRMILVK
ncbi:MAG: T9SS type A sorting domain-containing protein [Chlorobi bacterium]|nr:T9SS type A sorting domain-containing protein [Chlorobiota bacterium]MCI0715256.1 T9SS type A sorting domain-containing protein [Chlorobiota bacterium]